MAAAYTESEPLLRPLERRSLGRDLAAGDTCRHRLVHVLDLMGGDDRHALDLVRLGEGQDSTTHLTVVTGCPNVQSAAVIEEIPARVLPIAGYDIAVVVLYQDHPNRRLGCHTESLRPINRLRGTLGLTHKHSC